MVAGALRHRAGRALAGLAAQTALERIEVVVVDTAPGAPELRVPKGMTARTVELHDAGRGADRAAGVRAASAPVIAFLEDHAVPAPGWAEALIAAHRGPWSAVGYAFTVPEPSNYVSRAGLVSEAGAWMHPARRREVPSLPCSNVSIKREALLAVTDDLASFLLYNHVLDGQLERTGQPMLLEPDAVIAHEYLTRLWPLLAVNFGHSRLLAEARAVGWGRLRRLVWALGTPLSAPVVRAARLARGLSGPAAAVRVVAHLPLLALSFAAAALGEAIGYLRGAGGWPERIEAFELETPRLDSL